MKIYFAASIRGGRDDVLIYAKIINLLKNYGKVLTEHIANPDLTTIGEVDETDRDIHDRDMSWLLSADIVVAEVTTPSLGVGYEIGRAAENDIPVLCLYRIQKGKKLSAMIAGNKKITTMQYVDYQAIADFIKDFFATNHDAKTS